PRSAAALMLIVPALVLTLVPRLMPPRIWLPVLLRMSVPPPTLVRLPVLPAPLVMAPLAFSVEESTLNVEAAFTRLIAPETVLAPLMLSIVAVLPLSVIGLARFRLAVLPC